MSKYIRTKDGEVFDTEVNGAWEKNDGTIGIPTINGIVVIPKELIIKQADTIKELCDKFVFHTTDGYEQHFLSYGHLEEVLDNKNIDLKEYLSCRTIYGAVWTDKGLIYVAKLNEKGELELL